MPITFKLVDSQANEVNLTDVTDEMWPSLVEGLARLNGWVPEIPDPQNPGLNIPNPVTKEQAALAHFTEFLRNAAMSGFLDDLQATHQTNVENKRAEIDLAITNP